ncbi:MAG: hypothetical protein Q9218_004827 [Villophora microphyllina]
MLLNNAVVALALMATACLSAPTNEGASALLERRDFTFGDRTYGNPVCKDPSQGGGTQTAPADELNRLADLFAGNGVYCVTADGSTVATGASNWSLESSCGKGGAAIWMQSYVGYFSIRARCGHQANVALALRALVSER